MKPQFPETRVEMVTDYLHGTEVKDPYRWLEDKSAPEVKAWTARQTRFLLETLDGAPDRAWLERRLWQILESGNLSVPISTRRPDDQGILLFFTEQTGRQNQPVLYVRDGWDGPSRPLIDPNELAADGRIALDWWFASQDGAFVAYGLSEGGDEESTLGILEVATGRVLPEAIPRTTACSLAWLSSSEGFYYTRYPSPGSVPAGEEHYHRHVFFHRLGTDPKGDPRVFGEGVGWSEWPMVVLSLDDRFLVVEVLDGPMRTDVFVLDTQSSSPTRAVPAVEGRDAIFTVVGVGKDCVYVVSKEDAPRGRLMAFDPRAPCREGWRVVLPEGEGTLESVVIGEYLIRENITSRNRLAISGRSNGGLLVAAVLTQRPELFRAAISGVPLTDMVRYHLFRGARLWSPEYGCSENPEHFPWLHAYSPYHRVTDGTAYPATLIFASETDGRVDPMHARKMAARLQAATAGPGAILLRTESDGGHGAGKPSSRLLDQHLDELVFLFDHLAMRGTSPSP